MSHFLPGKPGGFAPVCLPGKAKTLLPRESILPFLLIPDGIEVRT